MIPEGWTSKCIADLVESLEAGVSVNAEDRLRQDGELGVLKVSAVSYGHFDPSAHKTVLKSEESRLGVFAREGCTIVSRANTFDLVGASAFIDQDYPDLFLPDKLWLVRPKPNYSPRWFAYLLGSADVRSRLSGLATGTSGSMKNISQDAFAGVEVMVPPLPEQRKIAAILSTWDEAITLTERLIAALRKRKQALMQLLLTGEVRFPGFEGEWEAAKLGDNAVFHNGRAYKKTEWEKDGVPVVRLQNLTGTGNEYYYSNLKLPDDQYMNNGDLLYMWSATFGPHIWRGERAIYHYHIWKIEPRPGLLKGYFYYNLDYMTNRWLANTNGMGILHITKETMESLTIALPSIKEQAQIAEILTVCDRELNIHINLKDKLLIEKRGLMQQLLTGVIRVQGEE